MPDTNTQRCLACGAPLNAPVQGGKIACPFCGTVNVVGAHEKIKGDDIICPECGAANPKEAQHCGRCGIKLEFDCPKCGAVNSYGTTYCVQCGVDIQGEIKRQQEEARRAQEEFRQRTEKEKRRRRTSGLVITGVVLAILVCVIGITTVALYTTSFSPAAQQTKTAVAIGGTATAKTVAIQKTATARYMTLFQDDFSNPNSGWDSYENTNGSTGYENGGYRINVLTANWLIWDTLPKIFQNDVRIEVDASKMDGPDDNSMGVVCRYQDNDNYYYLAISSDGYAAIYKMFQGDLAVISSEDGKWQKVTGIWPGLLTNHIRAECVGNKLTVYANDIQVATATDDSFTNGQVSLAAGTFDTGGVDIQFDNFYVYRP
jgi:ribosomal protein L40E